MQEGSHRYNDTVHPPVAQSTPKIIGIYGVSGCGKTTLLNELKTEPDARHYILFDGSGVIDSIVTGGLDAFKRMNKNQQALIRHQAITYIKDECAKGQKTGIVAGHYMFWDQESHLQGDVVMTQRDKEIYTHILYLKVPPDVLLSRRTKDTRRRPDASESHLQRWQDEEIESLRQICRENNILFSIIHQQTDLVQKVAKLLRDFRDHSEESNSALAAHKLRLAVHSAERQADERLERVLVLDADRTLAPQDTGTLFWEAVHARNPNYPKTTLKDLFSGPLGYSHAAFRQATLLYDEVASIMDFEGLCEVVAQKVEMYPELVCLLRRAAEQPHIRAVVVTSGLGHVWEKVLEREGLLDKVKVIGGGLTRDQLIVTAAVKAHLVSSLRGDSGGRVHVTAFGDSPLDLDMLKAADEAIVVVGDMATRSNSMEPALDSAITKGLRARQAVLPSSVSPRLDTRRLPLVDLTSPDIFNSLGFLNSLPIKFRQPSENSAALLATPMRDATLFGPQLRNAHFQAGKFLATVSLSEELGLEPFSIAHVQGNTTTGDRFLHEKNTLIVALMRGGEPLALGVSDAMPLAMFLHAKDPRDIRPHHLSNQINVVLVDAVVNTGKSIVESVEWIRKLHASVRIVVVAGVVQDKCLEEGGLLGKLGTREDFQVVALRVSKNKYTGTGGTDTGNRLFNTTHLA